MNKSMLQFCKVAVCIILLSTTQLSAREKPNKAQSLKATIDRIVATSDPTLHVGIEIVSLKTGEIIYSRNATNLFVPASSLKLFTCAAAIDLLGPQYRFPTQVFKDGADRLYILGSGDPSLDHEALRRLATQIALRKEKGFTDLIVDCSVFDRITSGPGWMWDEGHYYWNSPIDGLLVDHSCINIWVVPGALKKAPEVFFPVGNGYLTIENKALTTEDKGSLQVERSILNRENKVEVLGALSSNATPQLFQVPVESPHDYTAHLLRQFLREKKISCKGGINMGKIPQDGQLIATHLSEPLGVIIRRALKESDNLTANCLFKKMGQFFEGPPGTWSGGSRAVRQFLGERVDLDIDNLVVLDGSGESRYNLISPHLMVQFLKWVSSQFTISAEILSGLPISGTDGTLQHRLTQPETKGKIRAKTGTMTGISSLSGFAETKDGEVFAFSIMIDGFTKPSSEVKHMVEDPICEVLAQFSRQ